MTKTTSRFHRPVPLTLALVLVALAGAPAAEGGKNKGDKKKKQSTTTSTETASTAAPPKAYLDLDRRLHAYETGAARGMLSQVSSAPDVYRLMAEGRVLEQEKKYDQAAARLTDAASSAGAEPAPFVYLGETWLHAKNEGRANDAFNQAVQRAEARLQENPNDGDALYYLGVAQQRLRRYDQAYATLEKASKLRSDALPVYQMGVTRAFQQNWGAAMDLLTQAIDRDSGIAYAYFFRGLAASKVGRKDILINDMDRFLALAPDSPEAPTARQIRNSV